MKYVLIGLLALTFVAPASATCPGKPGEKCAHDRNPSVKQHARSTLSGFRL